MKPSILNALFFVVLLFVSRVQNRFETPQRIQDMKILNQLITHRDRQNKKVYYRVTYEELIEYEN